jgi:hypothetical protein
MRFGRGPGGPGGWNASGLLRRSDVQADLGFTADQKKQLDEISAKFRDNRGPRGANAGGGTGAAEDNSAAREARQKANEERNKAIEAILTPAQTARLKEIKIQLQKNMAIMDPDVQAQLGLSEDQKAKIKDLQDKQQQAMQAVFTKMRNNEIDRDAGRDLMRKNGQIMNTELGKILTADQSAKLAAMGGKPFVSTEQPRQFGGGGAGRRRNGGNGGGGTGSTGGGLKTA